VTAGTDPLVLRIREVAAGDVRTAGGKGAGLGAMTAAGLPVPDGFVALTACYDRFMGEGGLGKRVAARLESLDGEDIDGLRDASGTISGWMLTEPLPEGLSHLLLDRFDSLAVPLVAVRSSADAEDGTDAAWAGQLETFLGTTREDLLANVRKCWASLFSPRALAYRLQEGCASPDIAVAVVVQEMVDSEVAGVAFSVHPVTEDSDQMIIEAAFGLGEAVVSGVVTPDDYIVRKSDRKVLESSVRVQEKALYLNPSGGSSWRSLAPDLSSRAKLTHGQVLELAELVIRIETFSGRPCDIEWAMRKGRWYILQCRPITTLNKARP
jgi:pyruvate, water dikinase